jgi:hypothetical protein
MRRAERRLVDLKGEEAAAVLLSSQQAVLDLVVAVGGNLDVLDSANGEELLHAMTSSAIEKGRLEEREKAHEVQERLRAEIAEREQAANAHAAHARQLAQEGLRKEATLRERNEEIKARDAADLARAEGIATRIVTGAERLSWKVVSGGWISAAIVGVFGQFFVWKGWGWWTETAANFLCGLVVLATSLLALGLSLRWVPPGRLDLAAVIQGKLKEKVIRLRLSQIEPIEERNRVREVLRSRNAFGPR